MEAREKDRKRRVGAIGSAIVMGIYILLMIGICVWPILKGIFVPFWLKVVAVMIPTVILVSVLTVLKMRLKEIKGGEINEADQY